MTGPLYYTGKDVREHWIRWNFIRELFELNFIHVYFVWANIMNEIYRFCLLGEQMVFDNEILKKRWEMISFYPFIIDSIQFEIWFELPGISNGPDFSRPLSQPQPWYSASPLICEIIPWSIKSICDNTHCIMYIIH